MNILYGYLSIFAYVFLLIFAIGPLIKSLTDVEYSRKVIHICLFSVWLLIDVFMKNTIHQLIVPIIFLVLNSLSYKFKIYKSVERENSNHLGTIYFAMAITLIMGLSLIYPKLYYASGIATFCLTFGDGFSALFGKAFKSYKIKDDKSLIGFFACFIASTISIMFFSIIYNLNLDFSICILIGFTVAIFELIGNGLDNFSVVLSAFILSFAFINYPSINLTVSVLLAEVIFVIVFFTNSIDYYGSILSMFIVFCFKFLGGKIGIITLLLEYFMIFFIAVFKKFTKHKKSDKARNYLQILINGGIGTLFIILYGILKDKKLLIIGIISVSGCFIDSVSSDIGTLSKNDPYDIFRRKKVTKGISGGMSYLGTISALICSLIIAILLICTLKLNYLYIILVTLLIFIQTIIDSFFGSILQIKYECIVCGKITEDKTCCGNDTKRISGYRFVNNNTVNFISSVVTTLIAIIAFYIFLA